MSHPKCPAETEDSSTATPLPCASRATRTFWYSVLVLFGLVSICWPLYNRVDPQLMGIPFFLWFQFVWISLSAIATALAYKARA